MKYLMFVIIFFSSIASLEAKELLIVGADWCKYCSKLKTYIANNPELLKNYTVEYLDIDEYPELKSQLKIQSYPTSFIFDDQKIVSTLQGFNHQTFTEWLKENEQSTKR
jgi:thiol-disulfide isomerase/thioredoxin